MANSTNGDKSAPRSKSASPKTPAVASPREARQDRYAQAFANIVAVLMRDKGFRDLRLSDLEWLVMPAVISGQWELAHSTVPMPATTPVAKPQNVPVVPVAVALWATVSDEIDKRLSGSLDKPLVLKPNEWGSGDNTWLIAVGGDARAIPSFLAALQAKNFKDRVVKLRMRGAKGTVKIGSLKDYAADRAQAAGKSAEPIADTKR